MPFVRPSEMLAGEPLPGWKARFLHSEHMTFAHYDIAADAAPLHEHRHEQEEVWHVVDGEVALSIAGEEQVLSAGCVAVVPPGVPHSVRPLAACRVVIADYPLRPDLPECRRRRPERLGMVARCAPDARPRACGELVHDHARDLP